MARSGIPAHTLRIGTFVAPPPLGVDTNPGTQAAPVATIRRGMANAVTIGGGVDVYVAAGSYAEDVTMIEGISLWGGHESTGWTRDPAANVTTITALAAQGLTFPMGTSRATVLDGFTVRGRSGGGTAAALTCQNGASGVISHNAVVGPDTTAASYALDINPTNTANTATPLVADNRVALGFSAGGWGPDRGSFGIVSRMTVVEVLRNSVTLVNDDVIQTGILVGDSPPTSTVHGNTVRGGGTADFAFGLRIGGSNVVVTVNDIDPGNAYGGARGIATGGQGITQRVENNIVFGGNSSGGTIAFAIEYEGMIPSPPPDLTVHSNFIHGGSGTGTTTAVGLGECPRAPIVVGRFFNNVIYSGTGGTRHAVAEFHSNIDPLEFRGNALYLMPGGSGGIYRDEGFPAGSGCVPAGSGAELPLAAVNALAGYGSNIENGCAIVAPTVGGDFHLGAGSVCIDAGVSTALPSVDFEGDARPNGAGPDIGVDET